MKWFIPVSLENISILWYNERITKMQKLNPEKRFAKIGIALLAVAVVFLAGAGEVWASPDSGNTDKYVPSEDFEVSLQTPFAKSPKSPCIETTDDKYLPPDANGNQWVCKAESKEWQQLIVGNDGSEILVNYAKLLYKWLAGFIGLVAVLFVIAGGIQISTAGANQEGMQQGKDRIIAALVALMILFLSSLILYTINPTFFGSSEQADQADQSK